jgi:hypothetical protein
MAFIWAARKRGNCIQGADVSTDFPLVERFVIGFDIKGYSDLNARRQGNIQADFHTMLDRTAEIVGIDRTPWEKQPTGDGEIAVLPPDADMVRIVRPFTLELNEQLMTYNEDRSPDTAMRLRVAMHTDAIKKTEHGYAGPALIVLTRLLDCPPLHDALDLAGRAALALLVSDPIFQKVGVSGLGGIRPEHFTPIRVYIPSKKFDQTAHLHVPGRGMTTVDTESRPSPPEWPTAPTGRDTYNFSGPGNTNVNQAGRDINIRRQG